VGAVGVLAVQGDFIEHVHALERLGERVLEIRLPEDEKLIDN
jgi:glutamine amidotransferase PdxT